MVPVITGAGIGLVVSILIAVFFKSQDYNTGGFGGGFALAFRFIVEVCLIGAAVAGAVAVTVIGSIAGWQLYGAYIGVRVIALILEALKN